MLKAIFTEGIDIVTVEGLTQWDIGQQLQITLKTLPASFQVHFAGKKDKIAYVVAATSSNGVATIDIPNIVLQKDDPVTAWIYIISNNEGETVKAINLPIKARTKPSDYAYTEKEILNYETVIAKAEALVTSAAESESNAQQSADSALNSAQTAEEVKLYVAGIVAGNEAYTKYEGDVRYAPVLAVEKTGTAIAINDSANMPLLNLNVYGKTTQDGTPTPDAPVEIVSVENPTVNVCKKNLLKIYSSTNSQNGITFTHNVDGSITVSGTATANSYDIIMGSNLISQKGGVPLKNGNYILSGCPSGGAMDVFQIQFYNYNGKAYVGRDIGQGINVPFTNESGTWNIAIVIGVGTTINETFYPMLRYAEYTDSTFEAYSEQAVSLPYNFARVGEYADEVDLEKGVYIQRIGRKTLDRSINVGSIWKNDGWVNKNAFAITILNGETLASTRTESYAMASHFDCYWTANQIVSSATNGRMARSGNHIYLSVDGITTADRLYDWLSANNVDYQYVLSTPIETKLSEAEIQAYKAILTNKPYTTVLSNANVKVTYSADIKLYIDNKINEVCNALINA